VNTIEFDLRQCVEGVRRQDHVSAHALVEYLHPLVMRIVRAHLPRRSAEEDLAQEVFLKLFSRLDQYAERPGTPFEHWVSRLAVRTCLDSLRAERRRPELRWGDLAEETVAWLKYLVAATDVAPQTAAAEARETVEVLLRRLAPADRLVITLLDLEQRSVREISQTTGWSIPLVKVRVFRARGRLRKLGAAMKDRWSHE
jgi:RNA polymerase sigma-70 factor (ECF subfamily)